MIKNERAEAIAKKLQVVERLREKQRAQTLKAKKDIIKAETDSWNEVTLQQHRTQQQLAKIQKMQDHVFHHKLAQKGNDHNMFSPQASASSGFGLVPAKLMKGAIGIKSVSPTRQVTEKSVSMYRDHQARIERD